MREWTLRMAHRHREKLLYLVVGAWNTLFQYVCFSVLYYLLQDYLFSSLILAIAHVIGSINGFIGYRYVVFGSRGHPLAEYVRFQVVYLPLLAVNMVLLPLALAYTTLNAYAIQALFAVFVVVAGYLGNKYFAFRRVSPSERPAGDPAETRDGDVET